MIDELQRYLADHPPTGKVVAVYNSPGSPYRQPALRYDVSIQTSQGEKHFAGVRPVNKYPERYDVHGAQPGTGITVTWFGDSPQFTIHWAEDVTTDCGEPIPDDPGVPGDDLPGEGDPPGGAP